METEGFTKGLWKGYIYNVIEDIEIGFKIQCF